MIQTYVSHLRRLLQPGRQRANHGLILTRPPGYLLRLEPGQLDRDRFEALVAEARCTTTRKARSRCCAKRSVFGEGRRSRFAFEDFARTEIARLEELRLSVVGERIELELRLGRHGDLVGELEALVAAHPLREQLRGQLMRALYRSGRQAEALQVFKETRRLLVEELGIEPSLPLRELERAILARMRARTHAPAVASDERPGVSSGSEPTEGRRCRTCARPSRSSSPTWWTRHS